jgi:3-oxoacyl-[acyl-carrier-protein] synthase-3
MVRQVRLLGSGVASRQQMVASSDLDARLGLASGTIERRTGVVTRHVETARTAAAAGAEAAQAALRAAGLTLSDIDCIVAGSGTNDQAMPSNSSLILRALDCRSTTIPTFDINASCLSFLVALDTLSYLIAAGRYRSVLIVSSDIASSGLNWNNLDASGIFGDGAAAVVLSRGEGTRSAILASGLTALSEGAHYCEIKGGGSRHHPSRISTDFAPLAQFEMDGKAVFRLVGKYLPSFVDRLMRCAGLNISDLAVVVPHQASAHALRYTRRRLGIARDQLIDIYADHGNQVAASVPSALHHAIASGRLQRGQHALLIGSGAGVNLGGTVLCY